MTDPTPAELRTQPPGTQRGRRRGDGSDSGSEDSEGRRVRRAQGRQARKSDRRGKSARRSDAETRSRNRRALLILAALLLFGASTGGFYYYTTATAEPTVEVLVASVTLSADVPLTADQLTGSETAIGDLDHLVFSPETVAQVVADYVPGVEIPAGSLVTWDKLISFEAWEAQQAEEAAAQVAQSRVPGPGEVEIAVPVDASLTPTLIDEGDTVLLIDPGVPPTGLDPGRPRRVLLSTRADNFDGTELRRFVTPEDWTQWDALMERIGAPLLILPVPTGSDVEEMARQLDEQWEAQWSAAAARVETPAAEDGFLVTLPVDLTLMPDTRTPALAVGDVIALIDLGVPDERAPSVIESRTVSGWDGSSLRFRADADRWVYYWTMPQRIDGPPAVLLLGRDLSAAETAALVTDLNEALSRWFPAS